jgi:hypothetical protein
MSEPTVTEPPPETTPEPPPEPPPETTPEPPPEGDAPEVTAATTMYAPNQQCVRADGSGPAAVYATGATAGIPGAWTPAGSIAPRTQADAMAGKPTTITASPATAWTTGQYVQTQTAGAPGRVCWTGSAWVGGAAP